jgi:hypothetical protein
MAVRCTALSFAAARSYDAVIDFDKAVRDPDSPSRLLPQYDSGDHLHPNPAGYKAMADALDLGLFQLTVENRSANSRVIGGSKSIGRLFPPDASRIEHNVISPHPGRSSHERSSSQR